MADSKNPTNAKSASTDADNKLNGPEHNDQGNQLARSQEVETRGELDKTSTDDSAGRSVPQKQVDQFGEVTNRPGTAEDGTISTQAVVSGANAAKVRLTGVDSGYDADAGVYRENGQELKLEEVDTSFGGSDRKVFRAEDGRILVVAGDDVEQQLVPGTIPYATASDTIARENEASSSKSSK